LAEEGELTEGPASWLIVAAAGAVMPRLQGASQAAPVASKPPLASSEEPAEAAEAAFA
jgi:hypothetical protein